MLAASNPNVLVAFGAGMLSFLSPCVLPLVPGYLSLMSGLSAAELDTERARLLRATLLFVAGFTVVFVALGASASALGQTLQDHQRGLNQVAGLVVIVMGIVLAGVVSPTMLMRERRFHVSPSALGAFAPPVMGMAFAFGWTPCIGPILSAILAIAGAQETVGQGIQLLAIYSAGLAIPFLLATLAIDRFFAAFARIRKHYHKIEIVSGLLMVVIGVLIFTNSFTIITRYLQPYLPYY